MGFSCCYAYDLPQLQSAGGWAGKGTAENFAIAISLAPIFVGVMCGHISPLLYSPLAEE